MCCLNFFTLKKVEKAVLKSNISGNFKKLLSFLTLKTITELSLLNLIFTIFYIWTLTPSKNCNGYFQVFISFATIQIKIDHLSLPGEAFACFNFLNTVISLTLLWILTSLLLFYHLLMTNWPVLFTVYCCMSSYL